MTSQLVLGGALLAAFAWRFRREPRRLSNGLLLLSGGGLVALGLLGDIAPGVLVVLVALSPLLVLGLAVLLIVNGVGVLRRERFRLGNAVSLLAGLAIVAVVVIVPAGFLIAARERDPGVLPALLLSLLGVAGYVGFVFTLVALYALVYSRLTPVPGHAAIVVLGSGVPRGTVPPLLASRLDKAVRLYRRERAAGHTPLVVVSGGRGPDEPVTEAHAMGEYLREHGLSDDVIVEEDRSTSTRENLTFSHRLLAARGADGRLLVVTSSYHALRAAVQTRRLRLPAQVAGAPTARYYVPNAFLREFVALLADHKVLHGIAIALIAAGPPLLYVLG
ncbi:YdcF family protein [Jiangella rhizosphaerae]|uniref:YdcF family protein n=1 Tax=Jiangella rhizosphaerae TaxID=2293569 RepID=A0A418KRP3_9ACTN|nr:YdcF family protein [Jiangella rhizosphaerae]RIQ25887.1 YdcF family protein [Jiangella rhizosphaerae]